MPRGDNLTFAIRQRAGWASWDKHGRVPPGRKKLPRLSASEEVAGTPRGGFEVVRRARLGGAKSG
jgi:hypothetical protein